MKTLYLFLTTMLISLALNGQSIRKNYNEMTTLERTNLVNAFYQLRQGPDLINNLANFHGQFFEDIHFNLPDYPEDDIFFGWHRQQVFEVEQAMKDINPYITIPFWNSSTDQSVNSPLWDYNFMGQFNVDWDLNRNLGGNDMLPFPSEVTQVQAETQFLPYSNLMERGSVHHGAHRWVGGAMAASVSPRDPIFYLHHAYIDKLWKEWEDLRDLSAFMKTNMIRYDGTYSFNGQTLPSINPNNITNSRVYGTFYGENQLAILDNYAVTNTYRSPELFFYQYVIQAGNGFQIPNGRTAHIQSVNTIRLLPGFHAMNGSNFIASIGEGTGTRQEPIVDRNQIPFYSDFPIDWDAYNPQDHIKAKAEVSIFPNPFTTRITLTSPEEYDTWLIEFYDLTGRKIYNTHSGPDSTVVVENIGFLSKGTYLLKITVNDSKVISVPIIKK